MTTTSTSSRVSRADVGAALIFGCLLTVSAVIGGVAWLFPDGAIHDRLIDVSQVVLVLSVAVPGLAGFAAWAAAQGLFLECSHCRESAPEAELQDLGNGRLVCSRCVPAARNEAA